VTDILRELEKPGRDPRPAFVTATFAEGVEKLDDLEPGMVLEGVVTNVAAFGAFVDVGVHQDGLVHVSAMSRNFVSDPHSVVKSGDVVRVKVLSVDAARKRISLTLRLDDDGPRPAGGRERAQDRPARPSAPSGRTGGGTSGQAAPRDASRGSSRDASRDASRGSSRDASRDASRGSSRDGNRGASQDADQGALADALRRAGLVRDDDRPGRR
jgi:protein Tex